MVFHAVMKIASFFCAGAVIHQTDRQYVHELNGLGYKMPCDFTTATACSRAVTGVGATPACGSQELKGQIAAFTPKPTNAMT